MIAQTNDSELKQAFERQGVSLREEQSQLFECIMQTQDFFHEVLNKVFNGTDVELFAQISKRHDLTLMQRYQEVRRQIQLNRHEVCEAMESELVLSFLPANWADSPLIENWHAHGHTIDILVSSHREMYLTQLKAIEKKLPALINVKVKRISHHMNPYDPGMFYRVFLNGIQPMKLDHWVEELMLRRFHDVMTWNLGALYEGVMAKTAYKDALGVK